MLSQDIRRRFLEYFKHKGHALIPSSPVVPHDDPTLLFNNAGMNQFKDVFLGKSVRDYKRAVTAQKCLRVGGKHNDLDNVGHTSRHLTFFEMLGNFSFGDYFKEQAISYAWEVSTTVFGFSKEHLWITIFETDDEAFELWQKHTPTNRIVRLGEKDNFWSMGETGPCGPCSELYFDRGEKFGSARSPKEDVTGERYIEFWNLVFMQFNKDSLGKLSPLPNQSIDTGAGLERVAALKMGVDSLFATDILRALIGQVEHTCKKTYDPQSSLAPAFHVIADHIRSLAFAIADGAQPSNVDRGYVLRKLLRRAVRYGRTLGMQEPFLASILPKLVETMGADYPELSIAQGRISEIVTLEEEAFLRTLKRGGNILNSVIERAQKNPLKQITGEEAFKLKDTYGLPLEEILLIAKDTGLQVNLDAYQVLEEQAKEKSRSAHGTHTQEVQESVFKEYLHKHGQSVFKGYTQNETDSLVLGIVVGGEFVQMVEEGAECLIILNETPFYPEKGGQVGDMGTISHQNALFRVTDCKMPYADVIAHYGKLEQGRLTVGESVSAHIDVPRREAIKHSHTTTHLLHYALQRVLGGHIKQAGSLVEPKRLRFDFNHHKALTLDEVREIERIVNEKIRENGAVMTYELSFEDAQKRPEIKQFFGEKYGSKVRVVDIEFSKELCGGTHVSHLGPIGLFRILKEGSIASGVRRIEATTGKEAENFMYDNENSALAAAEMLKTALPKLPEKLSTLLEENKQLALQLKQFKRAAVKELSEKLAADALSKGAFSFVCAAVSLDGEDLALLAEELMQKLRSGVVVLGAKQTDRCQLLVRVSSDLVTKGIAANLLVKECAPLIGGSGGGKAESAQAGGKESSKLNEAIAHAQSILEKWM